MQKSKWQTAKEHLESIMPEWVYEAELYGASYCYGMGKLVCTEPEGYAYKIAIEALEIAERLERVDICSTFRHNCHLYEMGHTPDYVSGFGEGYWQAIDDVRGEVAQGDV